MSAALFFGLLHGALAYLSEWYRVEVFSKAGYFGGIMIGVVAAVGGILAINTMVGRGRPQWFVNWIREKETLLP